LEGYFDLRISVQTSNLKPTRWHQVEVLAHHRFAGISYEKFLVDSAYSMTWIAIPFWELALLAALLPAVWIARRWRQRRPPPGHCRVCGYDLRATPERCPECGAIPQVLTADERG
jgi:hypothetical protein